MVENPVRTWITDNTESGERHEYETSKSLLGVQGRLLYENQKYLNPYQRIDDKELNAISEDYFSSFENRNYTPVQNTSEYDSNSYWRHRTQAENLDNSFEMKYSVWAREAQSFFQTSWDQHPGLQFYFKKQFNITTPDQITPQMVSNLYAHYFLESSDEANTLKGVKLFVHDILQIHENEGKIDIDLLKTHKDDIRLLAQMFGVDYEKRDGKVASDIVVTEMIEGEARLKNNRGAFVQQVIPQLNRVEANQMERAVLEHVSALPFDREDVQKDLIRVVRDNERSLITSGTGSGKTTIGPLVLANDQAFQDYKFLVSVPTQLVTSETGEYLKVVAARKGMRELAEGISWQHGDEKRLVLKEKERIAVMTEGVLVHKIMDIKTPDDLDRVVGKGKKLCLMFDEAHMLTKNGVLAYYIGMELQKNPELKDRIKIVFMSATVSKELFQEKGQIRDEAVLDVEVPTRHNIESIWATQEKRKNIQTDPTINTETIITDTTAKVEQILTQQTDFRHIVVFLPGEGEIKGVDESLAKIKASNPEWEDIEIMWLYGKSTQEEKDRANAEARRRGKRIIFLCTDAAKTGVTLDGVTDVVISGLGRQIEFNPILGEDELKLKPLSGADITQMKGRTGRTNDGRVHYLYITEADFNNPRIVEPYSSAETERSDICEIILSLKALGVKDIHENLLFTKMPPTQISHALLTLQRLGALNAAEEITEDIGRYMNEKPVDYHMARALYSADKEYGALEEVVTIAAVNAAQKKGFFSDLRDSPDKDAIMKNRERFLLKPDGSGPIDGSDFLTYLTIWREYDDIARKMYPGKQHFSPEELKKLKVERQAWCAKYGISYNAIEGAASNREKVLQRVGINNPGVRGKADLESVERSIIKGYQDRLLVGEPGENTYRLYYNPMNPEEDWKFSPTFEVNTDPRRLSLRNTIFARKLEHRKIIADSLSKIDTHQGPRYFAQTCQRVLPNTIPGF